jgi:phosphatidylserine decarboxylase
VKRSARPISSPDDPLVCVTPVDGRGLFFSDVRTLEKFSIKGQHFDFFTFLGGGALAEQWSRTGAAVALIRLNPSDYHRYHAPCDSVVRAAHWHGTRVHDAQGSANWMGLPRLHENQRLIVELEAQLAPGVTLPVLFVAVGADRVGTCKFTSKVGAHLRKGYDEIGHFAFGGSTVLVLFPPGSIRFDDDLLDFTQRNIETKCLQGMHIGTFHLDAAKQLAAAHAPTDSPQ